MSNKIWKIIEILFLVVCFIASETQDSCDHFVVASCHGLLETGSEILVWKWLIDFGNA